MSNALSLANKITKALLPDLYGKPDLNTEQVLRLMGTRQVILEVLKNEVDVVTLSHRFVAAEDAKNAAARASGDVLSHMHPTVIALREARAALRNAIQEQQS